ncbi:MAG: hypothetical protein KJ052_13245, partial [Candidatus Hydrogenedentes bacterium]|nr:hypothetical protein [Candidatus Hydrogenedentota bacterium]
LVSLIVVCVALGAVFLYMVSSSDDAVVMPGKDTYVPEADFTKALTPDDAQEKPDPAQPIPPAAAAPLPTPEPSVDATPPPVMRSEPRVMAPVEPGLEPPAVPSARAPVTSDQFYQLSLGQTYNQVLEIIGYSGEDVTSAVVSEGYFPQGWTAVEWGDANWDLLAVFDAEGLLTRLEPFNLSLPPDWNRRPDQYIYAWLNGKFAEAGAHVRMPAVQYAAASANTYNYEAGLVDRQGNLVGSLQGVFYAGDGRTTYLPNDTAPYRSAIEGVFQYVLADGTEAGDAYQWVEY